MSAWTELEDKAMRNYQESETQKRITKVKLEEAAALIVVRNKETGNDFQIPPWKGPESKIRKKRTRVLDSHPKETAERRRKYRQTHREQVREAKRRYSQAHPERVRQSIVTWQKNNREKVRSYARKSGSKRRGYGPIKFFLNSHFPGSHLHHAEMGIGVYIPSDLHHSIFHNLQTGEGMIEINEAVSEWMGNTTAMCDNVTGSVTMNTPSSLMEGF